MRGLRGAALLLAALFLAAGAGPARAKPAAGPAWVRAVPRYGAPPSIRVLWPDVPDETQYAVWRIVNGGAITQVATTAQNVASWRDTAVNTTSSYQYWVFACDASDCTISPTGFTTSLRTVWPIAGGHEVLHGFNEVLAWAGVRGGDGTTVGYHDGVDLNRTTSGASPGDDVRAPRSGIVNQVIPNAADPDNGFVAVVVETIAGGAVTLEYDGFNHIANTGGNGPVVTVGDVVRAGQKLARVGTAKFSGDFTDHVHSMVTHGSAFASSDRHFLDIFTANGDRDPLGNAPSLYDENGDGKVVLFRNHNDGNPAAYLDYDKTKVIVVTPGQKMDLRPSHPLSAAIDIHVEVTDQQGTSPRQAPNALSYWIEGALPPAEDFDDVKTAANPYMLYDFTKNYFGAGAPTLCSLVSDIQDAANAGCQGLADCTTDHVGACTSVIKEGSTAFPWPVLHHFIITHAAGEDGSRANVKATQWWATNAKEDKAGATPAHANYAGRPTTSKPNEARFPDGDYTVHVIAEDFVHSSDLQLQVRLENFPPMVKEISVYHDRDNNPATQVDADHPGCEEELYTFEHTNPDPYPGNLIGSQKPLFANNEICIRIRFSESMDTTAGTFAVDLDPQGPGNGAAPLPVGGSFSKTYLDNDTWKGQLMLLPDLSGSSDSDRGDPNLDAVIAIKGRDLEDRNAAHRGMDEDADSIPEADLTDRNHRIKIDLSEPVTTIQVKKTL